MSGDTDSKPYLYSNMESPDEAPGCSSMPRVTSASSSIPRGATGCSSMPQLHCMSGYRQGGQDLGLVSEGSDSSGQDPSASPHSRRKGTRSRPLHEDVEMKSSGSSGSESHGNESHGNDSHGDGSHGNGSAGSSNGNSKDSALLESSGSNKSSNSHSPSPPSSSNAFSLLSSEHDNPSTSGCSSEESAKAKTQKELLRTLKELKRHLPTDKRNKGNKSTSLNTLKYALRCVKQVEANEEYYQLLMTNDSQPSGLEVSSYTIEEIDRITSEYTLKNNDIFAVAVSLITGKIIYISEQAASILNCKRGVFKDTKFVEFLTPQDVSVFYSFTTPYRLPSWSMCTGAESSPSDCMQEKSFFCRISGGKECEGDLQYLPFRMTPYLMKVQDKVQSEDQFCCLLLAERVHSGYEAPRIPTDKRIFTTTHTPSCVFQDVDERAVPLLGYLPQDLIGTQVLLLMHPSDRPVMLAIHRKIIQFAGQPFDHSSIRFCARNGEYVIVDTSWSSFVNPWSHKVSFVIGRHKVRMGPVNEDVFAVQLPALVDTKTVDSEVQEITEQIHRLLLQPVHNTGSSGYGSTGSNDHIAASLVMNGENNQRSFQEICKGIHLQKSQSQEQPSYQPSQPSTKQPETRKNPDPLFPSLSLSVDHYRYLEGCNVPVTMKRKCHSSDNTTSSDEDRQNGGDNSAQLKAKPGQTPLDDFAADKKTQAATSAAEAVGSSLAPLGVPPCSKAESVVSVTSQCSYSSTIVHVGDKKPQPESEIIEDVSGAGETVEGSSQTHGPPPGAVSPPSLEREPFKKMGLTKQVLAAHTQKEEQAFLCRFRGVQSFQASCSQYLELQKEQALPAVRLCKPAEPSARRSGRNKKTRSKRVKQNESSDSSVSHDRIQQQYRAPLLNQGLNHTCWSTSNTSQSTCPSLAYPTVLPAFPLQVYPRASAMAAAMPTQPENSMAGFVDSQCNQDPQCPLTNIQPSLFPTPMVTPMVALVLPNYVFPQMGAGAPGQQPFYQAESAGYPPQLQPFPVQTPAAFTSQGPFPPQGQPFSLQTTLPMPTQGPFPAHASFTVQAHGNATGPSPFFPQAGYPIPTQPFSVSMEPPKPSGETAQSRSSTPRSTGGRDQVSSPPLFQSRCSSPLQLNLLQLEETRGSLERQDSMVVAPPAGTQGNNNAAEKGGCLVGQAMEKIKELQQVNSPGDSNQSDANSSSSDLLDILLHSDSHSGTSSATSGSMGSRSNGCGISARTSNSRTSSLNSSNYFGSVDSSLNSSQKGKGHSSGSNRSISEVLPMELEPSQHDKYVLQEPPWLATANADEKIMLTYQMPSRDIESVLREDRERLHMMQKSQPCFTGEQKNELVDVHPWMRKGGLPKVIDITVSSLLTKPSLYRYPFLYLSIAFSKTLFLFLSITLPLNHSSSLFFYFSLSHITWVHLSIAKSIS
uniref:Period circadian protein homolog 2 n=1 Tax=Esox lucius TaxID=8010 RepID=A0A6Q2XC78_ESOLU